MFMIKKIGNMTLKEMLDKIDLRNIKTSKLIINFIIFLTLDVLYFASIGKMLGLKNLLAYTSLRLTVLLLQLITIPISILKYLYKGLLAGIYLDEDENEDEKGSEIYISFKEKITSLVFLILNCVVLLEVIFPTITSFRSGLLNSNAQNILIGLILIEVLMFLIRLYASNKAKNSKFNAFTDSKTQCD